MLGVSFQPFGTESVRIVNPESMRLDEILPKERSHIRFGIQVHNLEEYIVRIRIISGNIEVVLQRISQFCIVSVAAVSYTHLDVYKRQANMSEAAPTVRELPHRTLRYQAF